MATVTARDARSVPMAEPPRVFAGATTLTADALLKDGYR